VLFLEDDAQLEVGFTSTLQRMLNMLDAYEPGWKYLGLCKVCSRDSAPNGRQSATISYGGLHFVRGGCLCSRAFVLSDAGLQHAISLAPADTALDALMLRWPDGFFLAGGGPVTEGSKDTGLREVKATGRIQAVPRGTDLWSDACERRRRIKGPAGGLS
jgi:hypothetical protein